MTQEEKSGDTSRTLTGARLLGFGSGTIGQMLPIGLFGVFAPYYYIYVVGLDPFFTLLGMFFGLVVFAVSSPIFGALSDNRKVTSLGKRRPFLLIGIPGMVVMYFLCWMPPNVVNNQPAGIETAIYFWLMAVGIELVQGLLVSTYLSMLPEQSTVAENRVKIAGLQAIFSIVGTVISILLPMILKSILPDPDNPSFDTPSGAILTSMLPVIGLLFGIIGGISFFFVFLSTDEKFFTEMERKSRDQPKKAISTTFREMFLPATDPQFQKWMGNAFFFNMSIRVLIFILIPALDYVVNLQKAEYVLFFLGLLVFAVIGYLLWLKMIKSRGLKNAYGLSLLINVLFSFVMLVYFIPMDLVLRFTIGIVVIGFLISSLVGGYLFPNPIVAYLVDSAPDSIKSKAGPGTTISGSYFGLHIFIYNMGHATSNLLLGIIFTDANKSNPALIICTLPIAGILILISYFFLMKLSMPHVTSIKAKK